jgi:hypothetical protein
LITFLRGTVFWQLKLQKCVAFSTTEAKFIAIKKKKKKKTNLQGNVMDEVVLA